VPLGAEASRDLATRWQDLGVTRGRWWIVVAATIVIVGGVVAAALIQSNRHQQALDRVRDHLTGLGWPSDFESAQPILGCHPTTRLLCFRVKDAPPAAAAATTARLLSVDPAAIREVGSGSVSLYQFDTQVEGQVVSVTVVRGPWTRGQGSRKHVGSVVSLRFPS
jgi:hypothetical protein